MNPSDLNRYLFAFFIIGQSTFIPLCPKYRIRFILRWIPLIIHIFITIASLYVIHDNSFMKIKRIGSFYRLFSAAVTLSSILSIFSNIFMPNAAERIFELCVCMVKDLEKHFGMATNVDSLLRPYKQNMLITIGIFLIFITMRFAVYTPVLNRNTDFALIAMYFFRYVFINYFIFHVILYHSIFEFLNKNLERISDPMNGKKLNKIQLYNQLAYVTTVHQRLWQISRTIDYRFGWTLLGLLLESFINIMNMAYWIFWYLNSYTGTLTVILRNYSITYCKYKIHYFLIWFNCQVI